MRNENFKGLAALPILSFTPSIAALLNHPAKLPVLWCFLETERQEKGAAIEKDRFKFKSLVIASEYGFGEFLRVEHRPGLEEL
jgi:hypothetical protein